MYATAAITKHHRLVGLNNRNLFFQFGNLNIQAPGVSRVGFTLSPLCLLVDGHPLPLPSPGLPSLCLSVS